MEAGKLIELSLGQEPGEFRLNLDGMSLTIHLKNQKREEGAREGAEHTTSLTPAPAFPASSASSDGTLQDTEKPDTRSMWGPTTPTPGAR